LKTGLELLREPFPEHQISQLPKGTKAQNECQPSEKINCKICGGWHHPKIVHLAYVGHAALTDRLLDADPLWTWEPLALKDGLPAFDSTGGLWIRLTVCGHARIGYGHAAASQYKEIGSREKEVIGDALRNAAMRFGAALNLWHKGELHVAEPESALPDPSATEPITENDALKTIIETWKGNVIAFSENCTVESMKAYWPDKKAEIIHDCGNEGASEVYKLFNDTYKKILAGTK